MNFKLLGLGTTGAVAVTGASVGVAYLAGAFDDGSFVPTGKTLKTRYPKLKIKKYQKSTDTISYDNSFWIGKTKALKTKPYYTDKAIWNPILKSIERNKTGGKYNFQENHFVLDNHNTFTPGDGEVAEVIGKYCDYSADREEQTIKNYADILKDLCTG